MKNVTKSFLIASIISLSVFCVGCAKKDITPSEENTTSRSNDSKGELISDSPYHSTITRFVDCDAKTIIYNGNNAMTAVSMNVDNSDFINKKCGAN